MLNPLIRKIFDRNEDGDFDITYQSDQVAQMFLRKQRTFSENKVFPHAKIGDFEDSVFNKVRAIVKNQRPNHPWIEFSNDELLKSAGLCKTDLQSGEQGYTLAAILLFGTEQLILNALPHYKTDAILRRENLDRYDDRDDIRVNLIESYDRLMSFVAKHLPDKFYLEGDQRIGLRDILFREIIGNILIHREYTNPYPAKLIIEGDKVSTENWNKPHGNGNIDPVNFTPYPKNPMIAKFFKEIGWVDELGSGIRNTYKYCNLYTPNTRPQFIEGDIFRTIVPLVEEFKEKSSEKSSEKILRLINENNKITIAELSDNLGIGSRAVEKQIAKLKSANRLKRIGADKGGYWQVITNNK